VRLARRSLWLLAACAVFATAAVAGFTVAERITPDFLRVEIQERLEAALGSPVRVESVGIGLGLRVALIGRGIEAYPGPGGPALRVERAVVELRPFSHLTGQRRMRRLVLEGPTLRVSRDADGAWAPAPLARLLPEDEPASPAVLRNPDEILSPLIVLEASTRSLLQGELPADRLEIHAGRIEWASSTGATGHDERAEGERRSIGWHAIDLEMRRRPLLGETLLHLHARLADRAVERGTIEIEGRHARDGAIRFAVAATDLDLDAATSVPAALPPRLRLAGIASGVVLFEAPAPGSGRLEVDLVGRDIRGAAPESEPTLGPLAASRLEIAGAVEIDPQGVRLRGTRLRSDRLGFRLEGRVERPLRGASVGELSLALEEVRLEDARRLLAWLPDVRREEAEALLANLEAGRLHRLQLGGAAPLGEWQAFLAGRSKRMPRDFELLAELEEVRMRAGDDRIEDLGGRLAWAGEHLEVRGLEARLAGRELPVLDLEVENISSFFATDPELRRLRASAPPLAGLGALWKDLRPTKREGEPGRMPVALGLAIERLEHPMFLWPIEGLAAQITPIEQGVRVEARDGIWGGVPIELAAEWLFEPEERVVARVVAGRGEGAAPAQVAEVAPAPEPAEPDPDAGAWAHGTLTVGPVDEARWKQHGATARFELRGERLRLSDAQLDLAPHGRGVANARIDLSQSDAAPFQLSFEIFDGDLPTLGAAVRLPAEIASGRVDVAGSLEGRFDPAAPLVAGLAGLIEVDAREGTLRKQVPAVMALALASEVLSPIGRRERVRYDRIRTLLELDRGRLSTESLSLDGPDARAFASGRVALGEPPHAVEAQVVLFLFRPMDRVLDKIPIVNFLLLGPNRNLLAAHYELAGSWEDPSVRLVPLETLASGPGTLVFERLPSIVERGLEALGGIFGRAGPEAPPAPGEPATPPRES
jgi:hypothetical protein